MLAGVGSQRQAWVARAAARPSDRSTRRHARERVSWGLGGQGGGSARRRCLRRRRPSPVACLQRAQALIARGGRKGYLRERLPLLPPLPSPLSPMLPLLPVLLQQPA